MTCKDCIHYDKCMDNLYRQFPNYKGREIITDSVCDFFKNKADFVEVVRCKDCEDYSCGRCQQISYIMDGYYRGSEERTPNDFCSYGKPKNDKE